MISEYYWLTKPGIIYGNTITALAGFFSAGGGASIEKISFVLGLAFIIGSACVFNNIYDRGMDAKMDRTKNRAVASGSISVSKAFIFGIILFLAGSGILFYFVNILSLLVAILGWVVYVAIYTPLKHKTVHATLIGSIAGAVPPVVGYTAVTNNLDLAAWLLFLILVCWQMPHFYVIAIHRFDDYVRAFIPVLPSRKGFYVTKKYMLAYIAAFIFASLSLTFFKYNGYFYAFIVGFFGLAWLWFCLKGFKQGIDEKLWAKKMFRFSLIVLVVFSIMVSIDVV